MSFIITMVLKISVEEIGKLRDGGVDKLAVFLVVEIAASAHEAVERAVVVRVLMLVLKLRVESIAELVHRAVVLRGHEEERSLDRLGLLGVE